MLNIKKVVVQELCLNILQMGNQIWNSDKRIKKNSASLSEHSMPALGTQQFLVLDVTDMLPEGHSL